MTHCENCVGKLSDEAAHYCQSSASPTCSAELAAEMRAALDGLRVAERWADRCAELHRQAQNELTVKRAVVDDIRARAVPPNAQVSGASLLASE